MEISIDQSVAILVDGNNIEKSLHDLVDNKSAMIDFDNLVPAILNDRALSRMIYFREGKAISKKLANRLQRLFHGSVVPCYKSADIPLSIHAIQIASKVDTIVIMSGDSDFIDLIKHLKGQGVRVEVAAILTTTAQVVIEEADYFFPISEEYCFTI